MKIFGFNITRCSKDDREEAARYEFTTLTFGRFLQEFINFMEHQLDWRDILSTNELSAKVEQVKTMMELYRANKFSSPSESFSIGYTLGQLDSQSIRLINVMRNMYQVQFTRMDDNEDEEDRNDLLRDLYKAYNFEIDNMITSLRVILLIIEYDLIKIHLGVDIIREYKAYHKRKPIGKTSYRIDFRVNTKSLFEESKSKKKG